MLVSLASESRYLLEATIKVSNLAGEDLQAGDVLRRGEYGLLYRIRSCPEDYREIVGLAGSPCGRFGRVEVVHRMSIAGAVTILNPGAVTHGGWRLGQSADPDGFYDTADMDEA